MTDDAGCSSVQVFTGRTMSCNGGPAAEKSHQVTVDPPPPPANITPPAITDGASPLVLTPLKSTTGTWTDDPTTFQRQWLRCDTSGNSCTPITPYRTRKDYTPRGGDVGHTLRVQVIATSVHGDSEPAVSDPTGVVTKGLAVNVELPTIVNGASPVESTPLKSTPGKWTNGPNTFYRQWLRCDTGGDDCESVTDYRTRKDYTPRASDVGYTLRVQVIAVNVAGDSDTAVSAPSGVVAPAP